MSGNVHVFGSINLDLVTKTQRHPAPGETVIGSNINLMPGGKGANQALAAALEPLAGKSSVKMIGAVGNDGFASLALQNLQPGGVDTGGIRSVSQPTGLALIVINEEGENTIVVSPGANAHVKADQLAGISFNAGDILLTQSEIEAEEVFKAHQIAKEAGCRVIHNSAPATQIPTEAFQNIDYLIANRSEILILANFDPHDDPKQAARRLHSDYNVDVVITLGSAGAFALTAETEFQVVAPTTQVVDTTGAGDAFCGCFAASIVAGYPLKMALDLSVIAGSKACSHFGAQRTKEMLATLPI